ncbi:hypothetical protein [Akkermansia muciniphila]|uniref:hypothetical protein n=1 Tax=Akkermansia muciniphila TaxID=239935 RepID=UPI0011AF1852|nr:hypothetical protein [Akkermansia muciniphila]
MIPVIFVHGEGVSDFGNCSQVGPLYYIIWKILARYYPDEIIEHNYIQIVSKSDLQNYRKVKRSEKRKSTMRLAKPPKISIMAETLGLFTQERGGHIAVLHSDVDFTNKDLRTRNSTLLERKKREARDTIIKEIENGFFKSGISERGVPLVPMPRTEAWLIKLVPGSGFSAHRLENLPGNDKAPCGAKKILDDYGFCSCEKRCSLVCTSYDPDKMDLESHSLFLVKMRKALSQCPFSSNSCS